MSRNEYINRMITDHKYTTALLAAIDASKTIMDIYENEFDTIIKADGLL